MPLAPSLLAVFFFSFTISLGAVISPGPVSTAIVSQAPRRGWVVGPLVAAGHSFSELVVVVLVVAGMSSLLARPQVQNVVGVLGGALLAWMGAGLLWSVWRGKIHLPAAGEATTVMSYRQLSLLGLAATISNPFWYAWWVTVAPGYLVQTAGLGGAAVASFYLGHISADFVWDSALSTVIAGGRRWMTDREYRAIIVICASYFLYLAWAFATRGIGGMLG